MAAPAGLFRARCSRGSNGQSRRFLNLCQHLFGNFTVIHFHIFTLISLNEFHIQLQFEERDLLL